MSSIFICAECNTSFEGEADDVDDEQPCPDCGEMCQPIISAYDE
jgi:DNA-directed RNA polymerase subunit RPC12/RpoP